MKFVFSLMSKDVEGSLLINDWLATGIEHPLLQSTILDVNARTGEPL